MNIPGAKPFFTKEEARSIVDEVERIIETGRFILGPYTEKFEQMFLEYVGTKQAIAVNSGTTALEIVLKYYCVKNKEVIVPTNTFIATPNSVLYAGGNPVFADIDPDTFCIDIDDVRRKITKKTKAVIAVHIAGLICPQIMELQEICDDNDLILIEDAAHAHGAMLNGKKAGAFGDAGCFSFYPTKIITTSTGGMITTSDDDLTEFAKSVRHHGQGSSLEEIINLGNDWVMDEISSVIGIHQLNKIEEIIKLRNSIAGIYDKHFQNNQNLKIPDVPTNIRHSYYKYPVLLKNINANEFKKSLKDKYNINIGALYYPPCHLQPIYKKLFGYSEGMLPVSENVLKKQVCLPMFSQITKEQIEYIIESIDNEIIKMSKYTV